MSISARLHYKDDLNNSVDPLMVYILTSESYKSTLGPLLMDLLAVAHIKKKVFPNYKATRLSFLPIPLFSICMRTLCWFQIYLHKQTMNLTSESF